jgi:GntR family transcriptional regulator
MTTIRKVGGPSRKTAKLRQNRVVAEFVVEHSSPVAAWGQVSRDLRHQIEDGGLERGKRLPTERELAEQYGVSRITVRQALDSLAREGFITRKQGSGTFVSQRISTVQHDLGLTGSWRDRAAEDGKRASSQQIESIAGVQAPISLLGELDLPILDESWAYLKRLQLVDGSPIGVTESWVPNSVAPGIADVALDHGSLSETLSDRYDIRPTLTRNVMQVGNANSIEAALLESYLDVPLFVVKSATETNDAPVVEVSITSWLGSRVKFRYNRLHVENRQVE